MSKQEAKCHRVYDLLDADVDKEKIAAIVKVNVATVRRHVWAKKAGEGPARAKGSGGASKKRTEAFLANFKSKIKADSHVSMRRHACDLGVAPSTIHKAIHDNLKCKSYVRTMRHLLTDEMKAKKVKRSKKILNYLRSHGSTIKIFSDKEIFTMDQVYNRRNDRAIEESSDKVKGIYRTKHPWQVMVLGVLASDGKKMPPYFFKDGEKIGMAEYYRVLRYTILPWIKVNYPEGNYVWVQDGAPSHMSAKNQKFCKDNFVSFWTKDFWPPSSPDLNPLDFFWWSIVEKRSNVTPEPNVKSLKAAISKAWADISVAEVMRACRSFRGRVEGIIAAKGSHIKK